MKKKTSKSTKIAIVSMAVVVALVGTSVITLYSMAGPDVGVNTTAVDHVAKSAAAAKLLSVLDEETVEQIQSSSNTRAENYQEDTAEEEDYSSVEKLVLRGSTDTAEGMYTVSSETVAAVEEVETVELPVFETTAAEEPETTVAEPATTAAAAAYEEPAYTEPAYEEPVYEEPTYEEPAYEEPAYEEPVYDESSEDDSSYEENDYEEPAYEEPEWQEPPYEEPEWQEPPYEEPEVVEIETTEYEEYDYDEDDYSDDDYSDDDYSDDSSDHTHSVVVLEGYPATLFEDGLTDGSYCETCGEVFEEQTVIPSSSVTISNGSTGSDVSAVQEQLIALGYLDGSADGVFGNMTEKAVIAFQIINGLESDGVVGPATVNVLFSDSAIYNDGSADYIYEEDSDDDDYSDDSDDYSDDDYSDDDYSDDEDDYSDEDDSSYSSLGQQIADYACQWVGVTPYVMYYDRWTGDGYWNDLYEGTDCSGFLHLIFAEFGIYVPTGSDEYQYNVGTQISYEDLRPGDIVVYRYGGHVALYVGDDTVVHCSNPESGTIYSNMWYSTPTAYVRVVW